MWKANIMADCPVLFDIGDQINVSDVELLFLRCHLVSAMHSLALVQTGLREKGS